jgi:hypothetical protein
VAFIAWKHRRGKYLLTRGILHLLRETTISMVANRTDFVKMGQG